MKKGTIIFFAITGLIADIITITSAFKWVLSNWCGIPEEDAASLNTFLLYIGIIFSLIPICFSYSFLNDKRINAGTNKIPCSWVYYWRYKVKNKYNSLLENIHSEIYHKQNQLIEKIRKEKRSRQNAGKSTHMTPDEFEDDIKNFLKSFNQIFNDCFKLDLSINIYTASIADNDMIVKRSIFLKSRKETRKNKQRDILYQYTIHDCNTKNKELKDYYISAETHYNNNKNIIVNSVFDYVLTSNNSSWISNNLDDSKREREFFSTSRYYHSGYYKSLAVLAIIPPSNGLRTEKARGVLTFDSPKTGVFSAEECTMLMGLLAHLIFEVLKELE